MRKKLLITSSMLESNEGQLLSEKKRLRELKEILRSRKHRQREQTNNQTSHKQTKKKKQISKELIEIFKGARKSYEKIKN